MTNYIDETYKRVEQIIVFKNMNIKSFEDRINVSNNSIGTAIRRKASFKSNVLNKILNSFPDINPTWLLTGKGKMLVADIVEEPNSLYANENIEFKVKEELLKLLLSDKEVNTLLKDKVNKLLKKE
ncbi:hypothetical protein [Tenacibaculum agarivorans]|uniref:hypothetical protein n=1 Tax=Tenacibaculum agarivorans TaxID=1908389 RepID=UPI00094BB872|nr:hypothetical protein [Tenacibaculum agarivorans]